MDNKITVEDRQDRDQDHNRASAEYDNNNILRPTSAWTVIV